VFNLEVDVEHVYYVSTAGVLVHNAYPGDGLDTFAQQVGNAESLISRHAIDMTNAPIKSARNALGFQRNGPWFWRQLRDQKPELFSPENLRRIKNREAPIIDETWLKYNPHHADYIGNRLVHHHIDQGRMASGLPEAIHKELFDLLHRRTLN
jgi:hypothetical protein